MIDQNRNDIFKKEKNSKLARNNNDTKNTLFKQIDGTRSLGSLGLIDYEIENNKSFGYILVVNDNLSDYGWHVLSKNKTAQTITNETSNLVLKTIREPSLIETNDG